jgi:hypothetical protein
MDFLNHRKGVWFSIRFFLLSPLQCTVRGCASLKKYKSEGKEVTFEKQGGKFLRLFVWISSKNLASGLTSCKDRSCYTSSYR